MGPNETQKPDTNTSTEIRLEKHSLEGGVEGDQNEIEVETFESADPDLLCLIHIVLIFRLVLHKFCQSLHQFSQQIYQVVLQHQNLFQFSALVYSHHQ
jgi:hypothetical protein